MTAQAGDILRGGVTPGSGRKNADARQNAGAAAAGIAKANAQDRLARTTKAVNDMRALQASARAAAGGVSVPDGLVQGGLERLQGGKWTGANAPVQSGANVNITQTKSQALLDWKTFNVGGNTTVNFDQTAGGSDSGKWIAFNKVFDPSGKPSQIRGQIKADGQVYIINQNGIVFGAGSQVNARTLVASSLPINDRLVEQGLLSNKDAQFLFSALDVPAGIDGTKAFLPTAPLTADRRNGDIVVEAGATISGPVSAEGNGGRVMLVGANVRNEGTISTPNGQTILAAGLQVGVQAHDSADPSLRGLDVWVGDVGNYAGTVTNSGIIEAYTGSVWITGKDIKQMGVVDSSTSVSLNGRIDLMAGYGAVGNPYYDNQADGGVGTIFVNQFTGNVTFGSDSLTRILPDYTSTATVPGTALPENSKINVQGLSVAMLGTATLLAPHADITFKTGIWTYNDTDNDRVILPTDNGYSSHFVVNGQNFEQILLASGGQVYLDSGSLLDVSGTTDVFIPLSQNVTTVQLRGTELADSPVQRDSVIRGMKLVVDLRQTGTYNGTAWVGTPLGDLTSLAGIIERNVSQLTAQGGTVTMQSGGSIVVQPRATVDVSGGYFRNEGGRIQTTRLLRNGYLVNIANATPDVTYDGIYDGRTTKTSTKWGVTKTYSNSLAPLGGYTEQENISGANGGSISLTAPTIIVGGDLVGKTITGPRQLDKPAELSSLSFTFQAETRYEATKTDIRFYKTSPAAPQMRVTTEAPRLSGVLLSEGESLPRDMTTDFPIPTAWWSSDGGGFGHVSVDNRDGEFTQPAGANIYTPAGGSLLVRAANISIGGTISAPGGTVEMTAFNFSPYQYQKLDRTDGLVNEPALDAIPGRGVITLLGTSKINVAGMEVDDRPASKYSVSTPRALNGGTVSLEAYTISLEVGSSIDASGGVLAKTVKGVDKFTYGNGGKISILAGRDPNLSTIIGGGLTLNGTLAAYSANKGGSLAIRANLIQIGGKASDPTMLVLAPEFFRTGGFTNYSLTGIGKSTKPAQTAKEKKFAFENPVPTPTPIPGVDPLEDTYVPAVRIVENTVIEPVAEQLQLMPNIKSNGDLRLYRTLKSEGERKPVSLKLAATGADDPYTTAFVEARGDIVMEKGSVIRTDPGASVLIGTDETLKTTLADTVSMEGTIIAPGGTVAIFTRGEFRISDDARTTRNYALPTIYIGPQAKISTAGTVVSTPDPFGRRTGLLYSGGTISIHGNIVAEAGAILDVSGSSGIFDIHPSQLKSAAGTSVSANSGLTSLPYNRQTVATQVDSNGGLIDLQGSEMLFTDATLLGRAGGPTATGGTLSIFSGRYYNALNGTKQPRTSADINLVVTQSDLSLRDTSVKRGVGLKVKYAVPVEVNYLKYKEGDAVPAMGYFAADTFQQGGFASLDLGYKFISDADPIPYGGNVEFRGPVNINASGKLRVAGGGVIRSNSPVNLTAKYIAVGQAFRQPANPLDTIYPFQQFPKPASGDPTFNPIPTYGTTGQVNFSAPLIDIGTTVFQTTGKVSFTAVNGDIRGEGTLSVAGDITMTAGQIYPMTLGTFNIFAYDFPTGTSTTGKGSVTIIGSGTRPVPYSAGGSLNIFASKIAQGGTLRAPFGSIAIGWDGTDYDLSTPAFDSPANPVVGTALTVPTAQSVVLGAGSTTSVSAVDPATGIGLTIPFGLSPDGLSWYDPSGVNITAAGLPQKRVSIAGNSVTTEAGSVIDIRGGGDLLAYRWVAGTGGSQDLLGDATGNAWASANEYQAGNLVTYNGKTWSARRAITPKDFSVTPAQSAKNVWNKYKNLSRPDDVIATGPTPESGSTYWTEVPTSYAIVPGYSAPSAPGSVNNTGNNANKLGGDPGYTSTTLKLGDQVFIDEANGLSAGTYTLLPRRYALLPGAFIITPKSGGTFSSFSTTSGSLTTSGYGVNSKSSGTFIGHDLPEGSSYTSGYLMNAFSGPTLVQGIRSLFEIAPSAVVAARAEYEIYEANTFIPSAARRLNVDTVQRLPMDSGFLSIQGNTALQIDGSVLASHPAGGRGAKVDISSDADMYVIGGSGSAPAGAKVVLRGDLLNSWGAESLLIGGLRRTTEDGTVVNVRTSSVTVDNPGSLLTSPEITLVSKTALTVTGGSKIISSGALTERSETLLLGGDGTLLRVSGDKMTSTIRSSLAGSTKPLMTIGAGATISGAGVILDSTYATSLSPTAVLDAKYLTLSSGQISLVLDGSAGNLEGSVVNPHLTLRGDLLKYIQSVESLTLSSYRTIDIYGSGTFGSSNLGILNLYASGIRGYNSGSVTLGAGEITLGNPSGSIVLGSPVGPLSGSLNLEAGTVKLAANAFTVTGYQSLNINARNGLLATKSGSLTLPGSLAITTPLITAEKGITYGVSASGTVSMMRGEGPSMVSGGLGASLTFTGSSVTANTTILLPSGSATLRATGGNVTVGGEINVAGSSQSFYDLIRYADAGYIQLISDTASVILSAGSTLNVSANAGGGNAGTIDVRSGLGTFVNNGTLLGSASAGARSGSFLLDTGTMTSFSAINSPLEKGGFFEERNIRVRTGSVTIDGTAHARLFTLSSDAGSITLTGSALLDASGTTGGTISLVAHDNVTLLAGSKITVAAQKFNSAGKGGEVRIEAGAETNGSANLASLINLQTGSTIDLSVAEYVAGAYTTPGSSAFNGQFQGTLQLRTPQRNVSGNLGVGVSQLNGNIVGASSILVEGYQIFSVAANLDETGATGQITGQRSSFSSLPSSSLADGTTERLIYDNGVAFMGASGATTAGYTAMLNAILGAGDPKGLLSLLVIAPGAEIINTIANGDVTLGVSSSNWRYDWNLADFRFGPKAAPGMLTIRAKGNVVFWNTLSDGFTAVNPATNGNGGSSMWLATLKNLTTGATAAASLPINMQSWSYRVVAGADFSAVDASQRISALSLPVNKGSIRIGKSVDVSVDQDRTATVIGNTAISNFQVIRTGAGSIQLWSANDIKLLNPFASIYTAGVRIPNPNTIYSAGDFVTPLVTQSTAFHPSQTSQLGPPQQIYAPQWSMAGGNISLVAGGTMGRYVAGTTSDTIDTSYQMPNNWLYRRSYVNDSGVFGVAGVDNSNASVSAPAASTTWWIDFSNFFEGVGALGGGNVALRADKDIINLDAVIPTNARAAGRSGTTALAPDPAKFLELGGGDLRVNAGGDISGGVYYVERGAGQIFAGGSITTNEARLPIAGGDPLTELPTTLIVGKGSFNVSAKKDILLGPIVNTFWLPQGVQNKFWYKTYFNTYSSDAAVNVSALGGSVTFREAIVDSSSVSASTTAQFTQPLLAYWLSNRNLYATTNPSAKQPWIRLAEGDVASLDMFSTVGTILPPTLRATAFAGDINVVGTMNLYPSSTGTLELAATGQISGLNPVGRNLAKTVTAYSTGLINLSDASPSNIPVALKPYALQSTVGRNLIALRSAPASLLLAPVDQYFQESGSYSQADASIDRKKVRHDLGILHKGDSSPVRLYAVAGDISGLTLFTPKQTRIFAFKDITDVAFYLQNTSTSDTSIVSAGRDVLPFNENSKLRSLATNAKKGNVLIDVQNATTGDSTTQALAGDIQIAGPGTLEVLAGRTLDLGTGENFVDGRGQGITSIGKSRNPYLPFTGADIVAMAGVGSKSGGPAMGLAGSSLDFAAFQTGGGTDAESAALQGLAEFFVDLQTAGTEHAASGSYATGFEAIDSLFGLALSNGEIYTRTRDIRTTSGGMVTIAAPGGGLTMSPSIFGNPLTPPGIVTEYGGDVSIFTNGNVDIGRTRIFTLRGGDITIWSSTGDIAAGTAPKTVVTAPPTRILIDTESADIQTDLGGLATGGGIGVLASVQGVEPGNVTLIAPAGTVDAGDAGIQATGNITIAAVSVLNADNISAGGTSVGVPSAPTVAAPNIGGLTSGSSSTAATSNAAESVASQGARQSQEIVEAPSIITVEILGYGGGEDDGG